MLLLKFSGARAGTGCVMFMEVLCIWMCYVYGCVMSMDVLCIWMCYIYRRRREEEKKEGGGRGGPGRDAFKTRTHTLESGGKNCLCIQVFIIIHVSWPSCHKKMNAKELCPWVHGPLLTQRARAQLEGWMTWNASVGSAKCSKASILPRGYSVDLESLSRAPGLSHGARGSPMNEWMNEQRTSSLNTLTTNKQ